MNNLKMFLSLVLVYINTFLFTSSGDVGVKASA